MKIDIETKFKVLDVISKSSISNQRSIADKTKFSLGKVNYVVKQMIEVGFLKFENFKNAENKKNYTYILTPSGISEKLKITHSFIERKEQEYEALKTEIEALKAEEDNII
jgi:EPS-associated MarR family transcriptional regulator